MHLRMIEQALARVHSRIVGDLLQKLLQRSPERRSRSEAELDQVVAVDGEIAQPMRARPLLLEHRRELVELGRRPLLRAKVGTPVRDEVESEPVAVPKQEPTHVT